ncbi:SRPBCC family protein [Haloarcula amylovorans]|uniref:SRPBCC family protein n=1 Tax=Haloarcula amylovorans TaxID=2562280 RepID=UPI001FD7251C|nr:SRPBCC family protein [Halomicroarcula amylolytica]
MPEESDCGSMREVERTRFVAATPAELARSLSPATVLDHEGTFSVVESEESDAGQRVTARGGGVEAVFVFEERGDALYYRQIGEQGPFESMETTLTYQSKDHGSEVAVRSAVGLGLPLSSLTDRIAAWKRGGELDRLLDRLADEYR